MHSVLLDGCFIGNMIHPRIDGIFCVISIDLNTLKGFQDRVEVGHQSQTSSSYKLQK